MTVSVKIEDPRTPDVEALLRESNILMRARFASEDNHFLSVEDLCADNIKLFIGRINGAPAGSGALVMHADYGEVKSMYTRRDYRGHGVADALLGRIEAEAKALGYASLRLETADLLLQAQRLYSRHGFQERGPFGAYQDNGSSIFLEKAL